MFVGLVLKATRRCNLRCEYCRDWRHGKEHDMPFETVARVTAMMLNAPGVDRVHFTWHGGEPTLMPMAFYQKALLVQARLKRPEQVVANSMQTNGTRLTDEWCQFLVDNHFRVGVSIDGPPTVQDAQRPFVSGRGSTAEVVRGIQRLKAWGVDFGVLMVVDAATLARGPQALLDFVLSLGVRKFGLIPAKPANDPHYFERTPGLSLMPSAHYTSRQAMTRFLIGLYDAWEKHGDPNVKIRELEALKLRLSGGEGGPCTLAGGCVGKHFLVEANGDLAHCDLFVDDPSYTVGNVYRDDLERVRAGEPLLKLRRANDKHEAEMAKCQYYAVCNGGCPHDRYVSSRYDRQHTTACCGQHELIDALAPRMREQARPAVGASSARAG